MIEDKELHTLFKSESTEHLARLDDGLLRLEKTPAEPALLEEVFRESHSLKGAARMLGLSRIEAAAHGLESIFNAARKGETPLTPEVIEHMNVALVDLRLRVQEALTNSDCGMRSAKQDECGVRNAECGMKSEESAEGGTQGLTSAVSQTDIPQSEPPQSALPTPQSNTPHSAIRNPQSDPPQSDPPHSVPSFRIETVRVETRKLDDLLTQVGELSVIQGRAQHRLTLLEELLAQWTVLERGRRKGGSYLGLRNGERGVKTSTHSAIRTPQPALSTQHSALPTPQSALSTPHSTFGSLLKRLRNGLFDDSARLESTVHLLEDQVRGIRLLPLSTVFSLFPRMVRDLAKEQGKEAELVIEGGDISVDKRILEEMKDPLMHLIRNAIDHGIELPAERERLGKPRGATVRLRASRENASVLLAVQDDGRGLDTAAIRQEAKKRGLLNGEFGMQPADSTPQLNTPHSTLRTPHSNTALLQQLIFAPGFSTSSFVTELSGRGVGLDVVRVNVERLKGSVQLQSAAGQGVTVQLRLPLSLTTTQILLAKAGTGLYGLPVEFVHTSRRVHEQEIFTLEGHLAILLDSQPLMVARLANLLQLPAGELAAPATLACIVIQVGEERLGVLVDELLAEEEVVPKPLGPPLRRVRNVSALAMLGSGKICTVLNPADLLRASRMRNGDCGVRSETSAEFTQHSAISTPHSKPAVLLVEDSALVRAMEKRILEDGGYEVVATVDGLDALNALGSRAFAAVVSDIMMPNMDGLTLTARIRSEPRYKELPLILVTSLASDEDKRRGLDAGANAYIPKPTFDQRVLLETLKRLI